MFAGSQQPLTPYHPEERGIKVIQKYVTAVSGDQGCTERSAQKGGVYDYDFIGAVGLRKGKARKAAVFYHVYWTGFGPKDMTWEPEHHIFREDLEMLWSKYGRVNRAGSIHVRVGRDVPIRTTVSPVDMSCVKYLSPVASPGTRQEDSPPTLTMANTCVPDALDGLESSAEGERKLDWAQENAGFPPERRSFSCSQNVLATATIDLLQSEQMHEDFHPMDEEAPLQQSDLHETNSKYRRQERRESTFRTTLKRIRSTFVLLRLRMRWSRQTTRNAKGSSTVGLKLVVFLAVKEGKSVMNKSHHVSPADTRASYMNYSDILA